MEIMNLEIEKKENKLDKILKHLSILVKNKKSNYAMSTAKKPRGSSRTSMMSSATKTRLSRSPMKKMRDLNAGLRDENNLLVEKLSLTEHRMKELQS